MSATLKYLTDHLEYLSSWLLSSNLACARVPSSIRNKLIQRCLLVELAPTGMTENKPIFRTGEPILESGIYRVIHKAHRVPHEVTLLSGQNFPRCSKCKDAVQFELIQAATEMLHEHGFRVHLYELPVEECDNPTQGECRKNKPVM